LELRSCNETDDSSALDALVSATANAFCESFDS